MSQMLPDRGGPPPALAALLGGGGGPGGPPPGRPHSITIGGAGPAGPDPGPGGIGGPDPVGGPFGPDSGAGGGGQQSEQQALDFLRQMIDLATQYIQVEPDPEDRATMSKLLSTLHQYEAKDQKEADAAMGTGPAQKFMRRQSRTSGGPGGTASY